MRRAGEARRAEPARHGPPAGSKKMGDFSQLDDEPPKNGDITQMGQDAQHTKNTEIHIFTYKTSDSASNFVHLQQKSNLHLLQISVGHGALYILIAEND